MAITDFILVTALTVVAFAALAFGIIENLKVMERVHTAIDDLEEKTRRLEEVEETIRYYSKNIKIETSESIINYLERTNK